MKLVTIKVTLSKENLFLLDNLVTDLSVVHATQWSRSECIVKAIQNYESEKKIGIYNEGYSAYGSINICPYSEDNKYHSYWLSGWEKAMRESTRL